MEDSLSPLKLLVSGCFIIATGIKCGTPIANIIEKEEADSGTGTVSPTLTYLVIHIQFIMEGEKETIRTQQTKEEKKNSQRVRLEFGADCPA